MKNVVQYLINSEKKYKNKLAYKYLENEISFSDLNENAKKIASFFLKKSINKKIILLCFDDKIKILSSFYAMMYSNNIYVLIDINEMKSRCDFILKELSFDYLYCEDKKKLKEFNEKYYELFKKTINENIILYDDTIKESISENLIKKSLYKQNENDIIYITYTSGSTGRAKGILTTHKNVIDYIDAFVKALEFDENSVILNQAPLFIDASIKDIFTSIKVGASCHLNDNKMFVFPLILIEYIKKYNINSIISVPSVFNYLIHLKIFEKYKLESIKKIGFCGENIKLENLNYLKKYLSARIFNLYGTSETTGISTFYEFNNDDLKEKISIGKPFENSEILIIKKYGKNFKICKNYEIGEIYIKTSSLSLGYYKNDIETSKRFVKNPLINEGIVFKTGDLAYIDKNKNIFLKGRKDNQFKNMGYKFCLEEVDSLIYEILNNEIIDCASIFVDEKIIVFCEIKKNFCDNLKLIKKFDFNKNYNNNQYQSKTNLTKKNIKMNDYNQYENIEFREKNNENNNQYKLKNINLNDFEDKNKILKKLKNKLPSFMMPKEIFMLNKIPRFENQKKDRVLLIKYYKNINNY